MTAISIMMLTLNQKCNAFSSILGVFCHANNTPEKVAEVLSRMGIAISISATHDAIHSLSNQARETIQRLGKSQMVAYAYDNFDVDLKSSVPTVERATDSLQHLTSGLLFSLPVGTKKEDLRCSRKLWEQSRLNDQLPDDRPNIAPKPDWRNLLKLHRDLRELDRHGMSSRDRWNAWKFLHTLVNEGSAYFRKFRNHIGKPEVVEQIPLSKTQTYPVRAMDISNSTVAGNIDAITNLMEQGYGALDELDDETLDELMEFVVLFHGDLGTGERLSGAQLQRSIETSPFRRLQFVIFVFGLFHLKMACADAIWRMFIRTPLARLDDTSVMAHVGILRTKETGKITSNPRFRRMHQVIMHDGTCRRLDCWKTEIKKKNRNITSLDEFAATEPTLEDLKVLANSLAMDYVGRQSTLLKLRSKPSKERDRQYENCLLINQYYLLYEELTYAMNAGDIGRVEACFLPWASLFKATGKHKYASVIVEHVTNIQFVYDKKLAFVSLLTIDRMLQLTLRLIVFFRCAVRYSMLINPTGKEGKFRAVDWCVELNNLYTKVGHTRQLLIQSIDIRVHKRQ